MKYSALFTIGLLTSLTGCTVAQTAPPYSPTSAATVPAEIQAPAGQKLLLTLHATGDQIYTCRPKADHPTQFEWTLKAPEAVLYNDRQQVVGHHYGGPTWEMNDGSQVVGQLQTKVDAPAADAIPWLLLKVKSQTGNGELSQVDWIQRLNTVGGKAPQTGCDNASQNQETRVSYAADYYFFGDE